MKTPREILHAARQRSGKSEVELAKLVGLSVPEYHDIEAHEDELTSNISIRNILCICDVLGITATSLFPSDSVEATDGAVESLRWVKEKVLTYLQQNQLQLPEFEELVGWELAAFIQDTNIALDWSIDGLGDVCRPLNVNWHFVLGSMNATKF